MVLINPSGECSFYDKVVCGPHVGFWFTDDRRTISILTSRNLIDVPREAPMRKVIPQEFAQQIMNALCEKGSIDSSFPIWAEVWASRDVLIAELAASFGVTERVLRACLRRKDPRVRAPECPWLLAGYEYLGPFRVERGLIISDRCYVNRDHILLAQRTPALPGTWHAYLRYEPNFEGRTVSLLVVHENHFDRAKDNGEEIGFFGVDAGCAIIVDQRVLDDAELVHALIETHEWEEGMIQDIGVYANTYDGDGVYRVRAIKSGDDIVAIRANLSRDEQYDYHTPPPPAAYTKSLDKALAEAGPAKPYSIYETFAEGDRVLHKKFGEGLVNEVVQGGKVEIAFPEGVKLLVHGQKK